MDPLIEEDDSLGALVVERPQRIRIFEQLRLDYCCGGLRSLGDACRESGLDPTAIREQIEAFDREDLLADPSTESDWRKAGTDELCAHIVSVHHGYLRSEMPRISELLGTVVRVHGAGRIDLELLQRAYGSLRAALQVHIDEEEASLFPACLALGRGDGDVGLDQATLDRHRGEHETVGIKLAGIRALAGDYDISQALCSTHGSLLDALRLLEIDLHRHIHEENNVLLPRIGAMLARTPGRAR